MACFKHFNIAFRKEKDKTMVMRNCTKLDKITLVGWVDKTLDLALKRNNIMSRFKGTRIWPLDPRAMDSKIGPITLYTLLN